MPQNVTMQGQRLYFLSEGSRDKDFYHPKKSIVLGWV
jgi:hypothetical protein